MAKITMTTHTIEVTESMEQLSKEIWDAQINFIPVTQIINVANKEYRTIMINFHFIINFHD